MDKKVVEKIKKLLALATSSNEHEAKLAAEKANELLVGHNLTMQDIGNQCQREYEGKVVADRSEMRTEDKWIMPILKRHFFVRPIYGRNRILKKTKWTLVGEKVNVEVAAYVYDFLTIKFKELWKEFRKTTSCEERERQSYYSGLSVGLDMQMVKARKKVEGEWGLVIIADPNLKKAVEDIVGRTRPSNFGRGSATNEDVKNAGIEDGKQIKIQRGIGESGGNSGRYIK